jgi:hypothetical protein
MGRALMDDGSDPFRQAPAEWALDQELEVAAEVYGPEPPGLRTPPTEVGDEELLDRYRTLLGFGLTWQQPDDDADPGCDQER